MLKGDAVINSPVVDLYFHVQGKQVPVDHGYALYGAISRTFQALQNNSEENWLHGADNVGLLALRGSYQGSGKLLLNQHARFGFRLPAALIPQALQLAGKCLDLNGDKCISRVKRSSRYEIAARFVRGAAYQGAEAARAPST